MLSRLQHHEVIQRKIIAVIFIIFGSQRHLKSGLSGSIMIFGLVLLDGRIMCSGAVLYVLFNTISDKYWCLWRHMMRNHSNHSSEALWYNVVRMWDRIRSSYRFVVDDIWSVIVPHHWDVVSTSSSRSHLNDDNSCYFRSILLLF